MSEPFHFGPEGQAPGLDPGRADYNRFVSFSDPDGNGWPIQEVKQRVQDGDGIRRRITLLVGEVTGRTYARTPLPDAATSS